MKVIIHRAKSRGHVNRNRLKVFHTFSYGEYFNPERVHFGTLRVLNDYIVAPGQGFGTRSRHNMEMIFIPLQGEIEHQDNLDNKQVIGRGAIQIMSAGIGISHSEYNKNLDKPLHFLLIWILPERQDAEPRYQAAQIADLMVQNQLTEIAKPYPGDGQGVWIGQQAWVSAGRLDRDIEVTYRLKSAESYGVYLFVLSGEVIIDNDIELLPRDGMGITQADEFRIRALTDAEVLLIEVPALK
ncbi:MAG: pirin family protein [Rikenellaceae bacterium]|nr:pirin family protein [Rikenellaceae bacterium]